MQLGFRQVGRPYPLAGLGALEQRIAAHMAQLGLLYTLKAEGGTYYCPTALASTLCGGGVAAAAALSPTGLAASGGGGGYVIVETNFRVRGALRGIGHMCVCVWGGGRWGCAGCML